MTIFKKTETAETPALDISAVKTMLEHGMNQFKVFKSAHEAISILESWDNAAKETKKRLDNLNSVYTSTQAQVEEAQATLAMVHKEVEDVRALAVADADKIRSDAVVEAAAMIAAKLSPLETEADALHTAITELGEQKAEALAEVAELTSKKEELEQYLAKVKASLA